MDRICGLKNYIELPKYRKVLGLPENQTESYQLLAQGEYNINFVFMDKNVGKKLLLRVNCGSQMHLENQIQYEYDALKILKPSRRTPEVFYVDGSLEELDHGVLVMEYLPGVTLDYQKDMKAAAECLADIHSLEISQEEKGKLLSPGNPLKAILDECEEMVKTYMESPLGDEEKKSFIREMLDLGWKRLENGTCESPYKCCINTELNSTNFLVDGNSCYLIDWEKPIYGDPAQDLGHFLAPTTTFWKTDVVLSKADVETFIDTYIDAVGDRYDTTGLKERVMTFIPITCLRGITWCAMAWVQYKDPKRIITNESTQKKLEDYLSWEFLKEIRGYLEA